MARYRYYDLVDQAGNRSRQLLSHDELVKILEGDQFTLPDYVYGEAPAIVSGVAGITHKNDSGFNDMLGRIARANPHSPLGQTHGDKGVKATKVREAVNRNRERG